MISTITSKHPDRNRNKSTVGNGNSHDGKCLWSLANMRSNATKSASKMAQLHYVESINRPTMSRHLTSNTGRHFNLVFNTLVAMNISGHKYQSHCLSILPKLGFGFGPVHWLNEWCQRPWARLVGFLSWGIYLSSSMGNCTGCLCTGVLALRS